MSVARYTKKLQEKYKMINEKQKTKFSKQKWSCDEKSAREGKYKKKRVKGK